MIKTKKLVFEFQNICTYICRCNWFPDFKSGLKGNPVKFRSYPRSCKSGPPKPPEREESFRNFSHTTVWFLKWDGKVEVNTQARRPASFS